MTIWERLNRKKYTFLRNTAIVLWLLIIFGMATAYYLISSTASGDLPSFSDLENPTYDEASIIYDANGKSFGKYYIENRELINYEDISPAVIDALLATEDIRFFKHSGVDIKALFRVAFKTILLRRESSGGGSTVTQQLAKLLYSRESMRDLNKFERALKLLRTKIKEWITAVRLERRYTKEEIMAMYLNKFEFINGAHGLQAAAQTYFGVNQDQLDISQAALLVGMLKNPSFYNPIRFPENARKRRNVVLSQMQKYDISDTLSYDSIFASKLDMSNFQRERHDLGPAPYFRSELTKWLKKTLEEENILKADGSRYNIYTDGLKIHTTIDLKYQEKAEAAMREHMQQLQERYWEVWKNRDPWTYNADYRQKKLRESSLNRKIKESERYLKLHDKYLGEIKIRIQEIYCDIPLNENVIKTLIELDEKKTSWRNKRATEDLDDEFIDKYKQLTSNDTLFHTLRDQYNWLQEDYVKEFDKPVKMKVFKYNDEGFEIREMSPRDSVRYHNQHMQTSLLAVHPRTGHIKAWVGGINFEYFKYDHVNSRRQVGSTIKPFVYATAISLMGMSPCQSYEDRQYTIAPGDGNFTVLEEWSPSNANGRFTGEPYNLYQGLLYSKNSISVRLVKEMGNVNVIREMLDNAGISKDAKYPNGNPIVPNVPSICLGSMDLTLFEMAGAYTTFANDGIYTEPVFVSYIEDKSGRIIYSNVPESRRAINSLYNGVMVDMLKNNVGGSYRMQVNTPIGGKTGTTNDYADGWFMSITPELVTGVWVGGDDKWIRFLTLEDGQGLVMAHPFVQKFIQKLESDSLTGYQYHTEFPTPPSDLLEFIDCEKYKEKSEDDEANPSENENTREDDFEFDLGDEFAKEFETTKDSTLKNLPDSLERRNINQ
jgi:penicillin-binding protein 1A